MTVDRNRKQHVRRVASQFGRSYQSAVTLLERADLPTPITGLRTEPHPDGIAWSKLVGVKVVADDFAGVVLPGVDRHHPELLRLALTGNGEVVQFNPAWFTVNPMPDQVHVPPPGSRRRTHCPAGRYIYRGGELPATVLATQTMLKHLRRRLPDDLAPVATYIGGQGGNTYFPLYPVADCTPMPEQTPKQKAAWTAARTCAFCVRENMYPWTKSWENGGLRVCPNCGQSKREDKNLAERNAHRIRACAHARILLADPTTVIATHSVTHDREEGRGWSASHHHVAAVDHNGCGLGVWEYTRFWDNGIGRNFDEQATAQLDAMRATLDGKWVLEPDEVHGGGTIANDLNYDQNRNPWYNLRPWREDWPDGWCNSLGGQFHWIISESGIRTSELPRPQPGHYPPDWRKQEERHLHQIAVGGQLPSSRALMWWQILNVIAHGPHPAGEATCPHRDTHLQTRCGSTKLTPSGWCPEHIRATS